MTMMNQNTKYESEESQRSAINPINAPTLHSVIWPNCPHMLFHIEFSASCVCTFLEVYTCAWVHPQILGEHIQILGSGYNGQHALTKLEFTTQTSVNYLNRCYILTKWQSCKAHLFCSQLQVSSGNMYSHLLLDWRCNSGCLKSAQWSEATWELMEDMTKIGAG